MLMSKEDFMAGLEVDGKVAGSGVMDAVDQLEVAVAPLTEMGKRDTRVSDKKSLPKGKNAGTPATSSSTKITPLVGKTRHKGTDYKKVQALYDAGELDAKIAEVMGVTPSTIWYWRKKEGLPSHVVEKGTSTGSGLKKAAAGNDPDMDAKAAALQAENARLCGVIKILEKDVMDQGKQCCICNKKPGALA